MVFFSKKPMFFSNDFGMIFCWNFEDLCKIRAFRSMFSGPALCNKFQWLWSGSISQIRKPALRRAQFIQFGLREKMLSCTWSRYWMKFHDAHSSFLQLFGDHWHAVTNHMNFSFESILGSQVRLKTSWVCCPALIQPGQWCPVLIQLQISTVAYPIFWWTLMPSFLTISKIWRIIGGANSKFEGVNLKVVDFG